MDKDKILTIADEISYRKFNCEFHDIPEAERDKIWDEAESEFQDLQQENMDSYRKEQELSKR